MKEKKQTKNFDYRDWKLNVVMKSLTVKFLCMRYRALWSVLQKRFSASDK